MNRDKPAGNAESSMHDRDYLARHLERKIDAATLMADWGRDRVSLDGAWNFSVDQYDTCLRSGWYQFSNSRSILENYRDYFDRFGIPAVVQKTAAKLDLVKLAAGITPHDFNFNEWDTMDLPACWNTVDPSLFWYEGPMVFTRTFDWKIRKRKRVWLRIGGANYRTIVILNGRSLGSHRGGSTDFYTELTDGLLRKNNRLILVVDSTRRWNQVPMENTDWFNYGGIHRNIELIETPGLFIRNFKISLVPDGRYRRISWNVELSDDVDAEVGVGIPELGVSETIPVENGRGSAVIEADGIEPWSPENPRLYGVRMELSGKPGDVLCDDVGFRQIEVKGNRILLNGEEVFLKGVSCHEESVENGRTLTEEEIVENFTLAKEMGCNFMRLAHYPHSRLSARLADRMGLMLWEEIPVYWAIAFENPGTLDDARNQLTELIKRDWNRASVIIWSIGNENEDSDERLAFMSSLADVCRELDPDRFVSAACLANWRDRSLDDRLADRLDIIGLNEYFGWYEPNPGRLKNFFDNSVIDKPVVISEFGAGMKWGFHGSEKSFFTEEKHHAVYEEQVKVIDGLPQIAGTTPWILYDFRCPRRNNGLQDFYNLKGLLTADKKNMKPGFFIMRDFYKEM